MIPHIMLLLSSPTQIMTTNFNDNRSIPIITIALTSVLVVVGEILKQDSKYNSYFADAVNRELRDFKLKKMMVLSVMIMVMNKFHDVAVVGDDDDVEEGEGSHLLDLALHIQHPSTERYTWGSPSVTIIVCSYDRSTLSALNFWLRKFFIWYFIPWVYGRLP